MRIKVGESIGTLDNTLGHALVKAGLGVAVGDREPGSGDCTGAAIAVLLQRLIALEQQVKALSKA